MQRCKKKQKKRKKTFFEASSAHKQNPERIEFHSVHFEEHAYIELEK